MKAGFYFKLAVTGIRKNKRLYMPFILTCAGMVVMYYIIAFLADTPVLRVIPGSQTVKSVLGFGRSVIGIFAVIFLFYTHSFLIRRRKKEFGLYNILGMGKLNIGRIMFWETVCITIVSLAAGLGIGIALSKLAELGLVNMLYGEVSYSFTVSVQGIVRTVIVFSVIFLLLLFDSLRQIHVSNPVALLRSENVGEKPPKANWFFGLAGVLILSGAYYIAVTIKDPITALVLFFVAVIMVIIATYLLFVAGSVLLCRLLQKSKKYYYKANHFVSVSSMAYRMKRNGAGLASICILATMVLVMLSASACLYFGAEDSLHTRYPRDIVAQVSMNELSNMSDGNIESLRKEIEQIASDAGIETKNLLDYRYAEIYGLLADGVLETDVTALNSFGLNTYDSVYGIYFVPISDYNRMMGEHETLEDNQVMIYAFRSEYTADSFTVMNGKSFEVKKVLEDFFDNGFTAMDIVSSIFVVVPDFEESISELMPLYDYSGDRMIRLNWYYGVDVDAETDVQIGIASQIRERLRELTIEDNSSIYSYTIESLASNRSDFYGTYGSLFFLGIMLSIVFIFATVLIIYYKQISEGYEDESRFEIMQKVGMTKKDIHRSINSQMLTVFLLPLAAAVIHLAFAFPMIRKLLMLFNMANLHLFLITTGISILIFAVFYMIVYRLTSNAYYSIVSGGKAD